MDDKRLRLLSIAVTKPKAKAAMLLAEAGIKVCPIEEDEGNVDRYILSERLAVERRTGSTFLRGIQDKTLFTSAIFLGEHYVVPILIVEGQVNYEYTLFNPQAIRGALTSMMLEYGINVLSTTDLEDTVALLTMLARQEQIGIPEISLIPKRKAVDLPDLQRRVVEMLPGSGRVMARDLLQTFGSVERLVGATEAELRQVRGIGRKKAEEMHKVLHAEYMALDTERNLEDAIEAEPTLLFDCSYTLLARQHYIYSEGDTRHIVDLVFVNEAGGNLVLVELKRGKLNSDHEEQLQRYLTHAEESPILKACLDAGCTLRGVLATAEPCTYKPRNKSINTIIVNEQKAIQVLKWLRLERLRDLTG
jgi:ERCC4-type nuclease